MPQYVAPHRKEGKDDKEVNDEDIQQARELARKAARDLHPNIRAICDADELESAALEAMWRCEEKAREPEKCKPIAARNAIRDRIRHWTADKRNPPSRTQSLDEVMMERRGEDG